MEQIVESVPNFSTADTDIIGQIITEIKSISDVKLLNVEPDMDYNRTVVTFVGSPNSVGKAAFQAIAKATELIDMRTHKGEHPRLGATDVCPFIPVKGVSYDQCVEIANKVAQRIAEELSVPTYLYGKAAKSDQRLKLTDIRKGEYEGLAEKIVLEEWKPDFGKAEFNAKSGATVVGVRGFLIAYNVNIESAEVTIAREIGGLVRESGRWVEKDGERIRKPGLLKGIQGMGVTLDRPGRALTQVSMNVVDYQQFTKMHEAFEEVKRLALEMGSRVTGSEIVGLVPLEAMLEAGKFYNSAETDNNKLVKIAIENLGLSDLDKFSPNKKIIEMMIEDGLIDLTISDFLSDLASNKPAPGGGSAAALGASLSAALTAMVVNLTLGKEKYADVQQDMEEVQTEVSGLLQNLTGLIDEDTRAFNQVMESFRVPKDNENRSMIIQEAMVYAAEVPLEVAVQTMALMDLILKVAQKGNTNAITDAGVAALFADAAIQGALLNVRINLSSIKDEIIKSRMEKSIGEIVANLSLKKQTIMKVVENSL